MNRTLLFVSVCVALSHVSLMQPNRVPGGLRKAYEALEVFNYFAAREGFYKHLEKHEAPASYGLSVIYGRNDNPFTSIDSAFKYLLKAEASYALVMPKLRSDYTEMLEFDSLLIAAQRIRIDSIMFLDALHMGTPEALDSYMEEARTTRFIQIAQAERDELAFRRATDVNTAAQYLDFLRKYPDAEQTAQAQSLYEQRIFEEMTAGGRADDYQKFIALHPENPYREEAEFRIFELLTGEGTVPELAAFVEAYPDNPYAGEAWRRLYALEIVDSSPKRIAAFTLKYPQYPFMDELQSDFNLAATEYYPIKEGEAWGFVDEQGVVRVTPAYEWSEPYSEGLALVGSDGMATYINKRGRSITRKHFEDGLSFNNGYAMVSYEGLQGVINRLGQWVIRPDYDACGEFSEGFCYVGLNGKFGYINRFGALRIELAYSYASDFSHGLAVVGMEGKYGYVDTLGGLRTPLAYDWLESMQPHGVARYRINDRFGLISSSGDTLTAPRFDALGEYSDGLYLAAIDEKYGFINDSGRVCIDLLYEWRNEALDLSKFRNGTALVFQKVKSNTLMAVIDTSGKKLLPAMFNGIGTYQLPLTAVRKKQLWGYADAAVNLVIQYQYDEAGDFIDSTAVVHYNGKYGLIDPKGEWLVPALYRDLKRIDSLLLALGDSAFFLLNFEGDTLQQLAFAEAEVIDHQMLRLSDAQGAMAYFNYRLMRIIWQEP